jgi:hypothetical protein
MKNGSAQIVRTIFKRGSMRGPRIPVIYEQGETADFKTSKDFNKGDFNFSKDFKRLQEDFRRLQRLQEDFRRLQRLQEDFRRLQRLQEDFRRLQNCLETSKDFMRLYKTS